MEVIDHELTLEFDSKHQLLCIYISLQNKLWTASV